MSATNKTLANLTAYDLMSRTVVVIPREMSLRAAAHLLAQSHISGAPVVDQEGRCVGVISSADFMHFLQTHETALQDEGRQPHQWPVVYTPWQVVDLGVDQLPSDQVDAYMTPDPVTAAPETPVADLAREMLEAHIHRIIVVDKKHLPVGVVSTTDILAATANRDTEGRD